MAEIFSVSLNKKQAELVRTDKSISLSHIVQTRLNEIIEFQETAGGKLEQLKKANEALQNRVIKLSDLLEKHGILEE